MRKTRKIIVLGLLCALAGAPAVARQHAVSLTPEQQREFLLKAPIIGSRPAGKGVTGSMRLTLSDGTTTHDAGFQSIDDRTSDRDRARFKRRAGELNFVDSYQYNIAAYEIARLVGVADMIPVTVERRWRGTPGSLSWWVDDVLMDEGQREKAGAQPPAPTTFNHQRQRMVVFAELVRDVDRNKGNILYTKDWRVIMIDFSRAFRLDPQLRYPETLQRCERTLFESLQRLNEVDVRKAVGEHLTSLEIAGVMARRKLIVDRFDQLIRERGAGVVLY